MFSIKPIPELIDYCERLVMQTDFGKGVKGKGTTEQQLTGMICENTIKDALNLPLVQSTDTPDSGWDFTWNTSKIDIKGQARRVDPLPFFGCNFIARQFNRTCDYLLFTSYNKLTDNVTVCGIISKQHFLDTATYCPAGTTRPKTDGTCFTMTQPMYEILVSQLMPLNSWGDLDKEVK